MTYSFNLFLGTEGVAKGFKFKFKFKIEFEKRKLIFSAMWRLATQCASPTLLKK
jgi:hypothetical protein